MTSVSGPKKLFRNLADKKVSGVCSGIGEYMEVDPTLVRVGYVLLTIFTGVVPGIVAYFVLALIMPEKPGRPDA